MKAQIASLGGSTSLSPATGTPGEGRGGGRIKERPLSFGRFF
jgi:hypothetical protein